MYQLMNIIVFCILIISTVNSLTIFHLSVHSFWDVAKFGQQNYLFMFRKHHVSIEINHFTTWTSCWRVCTTGFWPAVCYKDFQAVTPSCTLPPSLSSPECPAGWTLTNNSYISFIGVYSRGHLYLRTSNSFFITAPHVSFVKSIEFLLYFQKRNEEIKTITLKQRNVKKGNVYCQNSHFCPQNKDRNVWVL